MAGRGLHRKPYTTYQFVYGFIGSSTEWSWFDGWCLTRGIDPTALSADRLISVGLAYVENQALVEEGVHKARSKIRTEIARLEQFRMMDEHEAEAQPAIPGLREAPVSNPVREVTS